MNALNKELAATAPASASMPLREFLREEAIAGRLAALRKLSIWRFLASVAFNYLLIAAAIGLVIATASSSSGLPGTAGLALVYATAVVLIAARQHALLVLMHEGAHRTVSRNRALNDTLSDLLCGAPMLISTRSYREAHLQHHQHLNSPADPDWVRKVDDPAQRDQWLFPAQKPLWQLLGALYVHSITYLLKSLADNQIDNQAQPHPELTSKPSDQQLRWARYTVYALVALGLTLSGGWIGFLLLWVVPMFLVLPLIMRIRSIAEHFALPHNHPLSQSRTVRAGRLERLLLAPHHIGLHIDHHLLASVPFFNLPKLHELLLECEDYRQHAHLNDGYFLHSSYSATHPAAVAQGNHDTFARDLYETVSMRLTS